MTRADEPIDPNERRLVNPRDIERVRFSTLREMSKSAAHYLHACQRRYEPTGEASQKLGSGTHALLFGTPAVAVFGPGTFTPPGEKKAKEYKGVKSGAYWDAFQLEHEGEVILSPAEYEESKAMADAIRSHPIAGPLLFKRGTLHEYEVLWSYCGRKMASHLDAYRYVMTEGRGPGTLIDVKTSRDGNPARFGWSALRYHYYAQLACYSEAMESLGHPTPDPYIVLVENERPYVVSVLRVVPRAIEFGRRQLRGWMEQLLRCEAANAWGGYSECIEELDLPGDRLTEDLED